MIFGIDIEKVKVLSIIDFFYSNHFFTGLSLGCGLITFVSALSETLAEIYEYHKDGPNGPDYTYKYGWCFFTAGAALILTYVGSAFSFVGYLNRYTSLDDMVSRKAILKRNNRFLWLSYWLFLDWKIFDCSGKQASAKKN